MTYFPIFFLSKTKTSREKQVEMLFKKSIQKTKKFIQKTLQNIKSMLFGRYDTIPRTFFLNPLSCTSINQNTQQLDNIYSQFSTRSMTDHSPNQTVPTSTQNHTIVTNSTNEVSLRVNQVLPTRKMEPSSGSSSSRYPNDGTYMLAQKMKELGMIEIQDFDHALDVEEALNYYSRLSCPVYVDIVDKFFMEMYAEFLLPRSSISLSSSSRRLGPLKL